MGIRIIVQEYHSKVSSWLYQAHLRSHVKKKLFFLFVFFSTLSCLGYECKSEKLNSIDLKLEQIHSTKLSGV